MQMKIEIKNIETLIAFFNRNFDNISNKEYKEIILSTLQIYADDKPQTKQEAINKIKAIWTFIKSRPSDWERPFFFLDETNDIDII